MKDELCRGKPRKKARLDGIKLSGNPLSGEAIFIQQGERTFGFRNLFGLAPIPVSGVYEFGGFVNLNILHPTAGREALSRESIQSVANLVSLMEAEASKDLAETSAADQNQHFQQCILSRGLIHLAKNVRIALLPPRDEDVALGEVKGYETSKTKHFYPGRDATILQRFASEQANLFHVSQTNPGACGNDSHPTRGKVCISKLGGKGTAFKNWISVIFDPQIGSIFCLNPSGAETS